MATFNGAAYLQPQLETILCQLGSNDELIVSDDDSTDSTRDIVRGMRDNRIRLARGPAKGPSANFSSCLSLAKNEYVFLADQDDIWDRQKITWQSSLLDDALLVLSDAVVVDQSNNVIHESYFALNRSGDGLIRNFVRNSFLGCCMAFRRELLKKALPIPNGIAHDWWLGMTALLNGRVVFTPHQWVRYRRHDATASVAATKRDRGLAVKLADRAKLGLALFRF